MPDVNETEKCPTLYGGVVWENGRVFIYRLPAAIATTAEPGLTSWEEALGEQGRQLAQRTAERDAEKAGREKAEARVAELERQQARTGTCGATWFCRGDPDPREDHGPHTYRCKRLPDHSDDLLGDKGVGSRHYDEGAFWGYLTEQDAWRVRADTAEGQWKQAEAEVERLRVEAVKRERAYIEAALLAPEEEQRDKWEICGSTWTAYAEAIVKSQARDIKALRAGIQRLIDELSPHAPGGVANMEVDEWSGIGMADIAGLRRTLVALLGGSAEAAKGKKENEQ